jgi:hypothetical protein
MKNIKTTLEGITTGAGYNNTIVSVQRSKQSGQATVATPCIIIMAGDEEATDVPDPLITKLLTVFLFCIARQDDVTDTRSGDEVLNAFQADVEKALLTTRTRGGYAIDTQPLASIELDIEEGFPELSRLLKTEVHYRQLNTDPTRQT